MANRTGKRRKPAASRPAAAAPAAPRDSAAGDRTRWVLWYVALVVGVILVYQPVWHGGRLWDDDAHLTPETLQSWSGLARLWVDFGAAQQYYPVVNSAFWIMAKLWGNDTFGYHLVNMILHATTAWFVALILTRLRVRGAFIAAAIFAFHPVFVESVAWMSELKNTLSGVLYMAALYCYLRFDERRDWRLYSAALGLFLLALGSKTVTASLPAAILVIFWWQRGRLERRDVVPLVPFFTLGLATGLTTAILEYTWVGARGAEFDLSLIERVLLAGRVVWFYAASLVWPASLSFNYPRWSIDTSMWWQFLYPFGLAIVLAGAVWWSRRSRGPLAGILFFIGTLFPALGFVNVYPFRYSYVADHFQYLASLGIIVLIAALVARLIDRWPPSSQVAAVLVLVVPLALLTHQESRVYASAETLYRTTIAENPGSVLARTNLAALLLDGPAAGWAEALQHAESALTIAPGSASSHNLRGLALLKTGVTAEAAKEFQEAIRLDAELAEAHYNLGLALDGLGRLEESVASYERSLKIYPRHAAALHNLANTLRRLGRADEAIARLRAAAEVDPASPEIQMNLGNALIAAGSVDQGLEAYRSALRLRPEWGEAWHDYGVALRRANRLDEAIQAFERAVTAMPGSARARVSLASALVARGRLADAVPLMEQAIPLAEPAQAAILHDDLGLLLMQLGQRDRALPHFEAAIQLRPDFAAAREHLQRAKGK